MDTFPFSVHPLTHSVRKAEQTLLGLLGAQDPITAEWMVALDELTDEVCRAAQTVELTLCEIDDIRKGLQRIAAIAEVLSAVREEGERRSATNLLCVDEALQAHLEKTAAPQELKVPTATCNLTHMATKAVLEQSDNASYLRQWMMDHIDHPFPTNKDKAEIMAKCDPDLRGSKRELTPKRCAMWFINSRRRSGWTAWARRFANNDRNHIRAIVSAIQGRQLPQSTLKDGEELEDDLEELVCRVDRADHHLSKAEFAAACKADFARVTEWIQRGPTEKVGDWIGLAIAEGEAYAEKEKADEEHRSRMELEGKERKKREKKEDATRWFASLDLKRWLEEEAVTGIQTAGKGLNPVASTKEDKWSTPDRGDTTIKGSEKGIFQPSRDFLDEFSQNFEAKDVGILQLSHLNGGFHGPDVGFQSAGGNLAPSVSFDIFSSDGGGAIQTPAHLAEKMPSGRSGGSFKCENDCE